MQQDLIDATVRALVDTSRGVREMKDGMRENEMMIAFAKIALRESREALDNASTALAGPYFRD